MLFRTFAVLVVVFEFLTSPGLLSLPFRGGKSAPTDSVIVRESGRSSIPTAPVIEPKSCGVLDTPLSRGMTAVCCA
jgi:hypothetical protein